MAHGQRTNGSGNYHPSFANSLRGFGAANIGPGSLFQVKPTVATCRPGLAQGLRGAAITVGSFDGIHLGHGGLIASTCGIAKQLAKPAMMLTFEPLPREYLSPQDPPARLTDFRERWRVLERSDLHYLCVLRFDEKLRQLSGEQFVELLATRFAASAVVVGQDFRFGRGGAGSITLLRAAAEAGRFELELVPSVCIDDVRVSSSGVRAASHCWRDSSEAASSSLSSAARCSSWVASEMRTSISSRRSTSPRARASESTASAASRSVESAS